MTALLIDDEPNARILLRHLLKEHCPEITVVAECDDLPTGVKAIRKLKPSLVFLDIEMPGHSGLELLDFFDDSEISFSIIFTTAYNQYAIQAFKLSAIDYLLKPISGEELAASVQRFLKSQAGQKPDYSLLRENLQPGSDPKKIALPVGQSIRFIAIDKIMMLKADNVYTEVWLDDGEKLLVSRTLKNFEEVLPANSPLMRVHRSFMINKNHVESFSKSDGGFLVMSNKQEVPVSPEKAQQLIDGQVMVKR